MTPEAFAAGWQTAELFHEPVPRRPASNRAIPDHLPGLSHLDAYDSAMLHLNQLEAVFVALLGKQGPTAPALASVKQAFGGNPIHGDQVRLAIADLHTTALTSLTVADFRLGKAYGLGRALAETVLLPVAATDAARPAQFQLKFGAGRLSNLYRWMADLKTALPAHSSYAVSWSLQQWEGWVARAEDTDLVGAHSHLRRQGQQWRALLSGERLGEDFLSTIDLIDAAKGLSSRIGRVIGAFVSRYRWTILAVGFVLLAIVGGVVAGAAASGNTNVLWAALTALVGVVGGFKGVNATLGKGIRTVEPTLWQSELDAAIAYGALVLPVAVPKPVDDLASMGALVADTNQGVVENTAGSPPKPSLSARIRSRLTRESTSHQNDTVAQRAHR
jgi:hypothetical protein